MTNVPLFPAGAAFRGVGSVLASILSCRGVMCLRARVWLTSRFTHTLDILCIVLEFPKKHVATQGFRGVFFHVSPFQQQPLASKDRTGVQELYPVYTRRGKCGVSDFDDERDHVIGFTDELHRLRPRETDDLPRRLLNDPHRTCPDAVAVRHRHKQLEHRMYHRKARIRLRSDDKDDPEYVNAVQVRFIRPHVLAHNQR